MEELKEKQKAESTKAEGANNSVNPVNPVKRTGVIAEVAEEIVEKVLTGTQQMLNNLETSIKTGRPKKELENVVFKPKEKSEKK
jgi:hypothetical protein